MTATVHAALRYVSDLKVLLPFVGEQRCHLRPSGARIHQHSDLSDQRSSAARGCGSTGSPPCCSRGAA